MKTYRFVLGSHHDISAETLDEAIEAFNEIRQETLSAKFDNVRRIEVEDEKGEYVPLDCPLRAEYSAANNETGLHLSA